ncbi:MAG: glycosyltransferase [Candidatus Eremiobacteraeota bacterium]|nr:glycosyltransferase [Candidatus Eremiobacteraeota bacterium]MBC5827178.1 glycosyltransferase [Candidatus Eremiobacteraeota bacterium]
MDISVVIPTFNRLDKLKVVLPTLLDQSLSPQRYEIVLADSQSTDGTADFIAAIPHGDGRVPIRYLPFPYGGRAAARNAGVSCAQAPIVLFTDADILATPDLLERHLRGHAASSRPVAIVGCELQVQSLADYREQRDRPKVRRPLHPPHRVRLSWLYFLTGNASVRRADVLRVGGFDEGFTGYGHEDLELGYRLEKAGVALRYDSEAINFHWHPVGYGEQMDRMELAGVSTVRFYRKHRDLAVKTHLGMTPISLGLHSVLRAATPLRRAIERAGAVQEPPKKNTWPFIARQIAYQYHYLSGVKNALRGD